MQKLKETNDNDTFRILSQRMGAWQMGILGYKPSLKALTLWAITTALSVSQSLFKQLIVHNKLGTHVSSCNTAFIRQSCECSCVMRTALDRKSSCLPPFASK